MSKNIVIKKNGVAQTLNNVSYIRTSAVGGGYVDWAPEDECVVAAITVTENGTYIADDRSLYGFNVVTVKAQAESITGTINGVKYIVSLDANGYLVFTRVD